MAEYFLRLFLYNLITGAMYFAPLMVFLMGFFRAVYVVLVDDPPSNLRLIHTAIYCIGTIALALLMMNAIDTATAVMRM